MRAIVTLLVLILLIYSCEVPEGEGGMASISGTLYTNFYNDDFSELIKCEPATDKDVFIIYGSDDYLGDKTGTMFDGSFTFSNLTPGDYTLYYYSDDSTRTTSTEDIPLFVDVHIDGRKQHIDLGDIFRYKKLKWNEGNALIKGKIRQINYYSTTSWPNLIVKDTSNAQAYDVYLTYNNHSFYDERIRTNFDGTIEFKKLLKGKYDIFLYSDDVKKKSEDVVIHREVTIDEENTIIDLGIIYVDNL